MSVDFARYIPVLASLDIAETRDFHAGQLGFVERLADRQFPENTSCYIRDPDGNLLRFGCGEW